MSGEPEGAPGTDRARCICEPCPSYNECMRAGEGGEFCITGKTGQGTFGMKGCSCPSCTAGANRGFGGSYYCLRGPAAGRPAHR